jgi:hypothetical protein
MMDVLLISTTDLQGGRTEVRDRMVKHLVDSETKVSGHGLHLSFLWQNCPADALPQLAAAMPSFAVNIGIPGRVSLSSARNILLRRLTAERAITPDSVVAFPDDDCWYPPGFLEYVMGCFESDPALDFWFCRYSSHPVQSELSASKQIFAKPAQVVRNASSNTIFVRGRVAMSVGEFDEALGVGTPLGGAEDLDYALRAFRVARTVRFVDAPLVGHRDKNSQLRDRYYCSGLVVLARHARYGAMKPLLRKIAVGCYLMLLRRISLRQFFNALGSAFLELRAGEGGVLRSIKETA